MKFTCVKDNLKEAIFLVEKSAGKRTTLPVLNAILISATHSGITLTATNLETGIEVRIPGRIFTEGRVAVPARVLTAYVALVPDEQITCSAERDSMTITGSQGTTHIRGYPADDFPMLPKSKKDYTCSVPAPMVRNALSHVLVAAASSEIKPELASVLCSFSKRAFTLAATDSFRLTQKIITGSFSGDKEVSFLLPARSAVELLRLTDTDENVMEIQVSHGQVTFMTPRFHMVSRLTEGAFPDYERIMPRTFATEVYCKTAELLNTLRLSSLFASKLNDVTLVVRPGEQSVVCETANADIGENAARISADGTGDELRVSFNYRYLLDGVSAIESEKIFLGFTSASGPLLMRNNDDTSYVYIAMPMKV